MQIVIVGLSIICAALLGMFLLHFLTVHPLRMSRYLFLTGLTLFVLIWLVSRPASGYLILLRILLALLSLLVSYTMATRRFLSREDSRYVPELIREKGDPGLGHTAIVWFTHGEPETYDPIGWLNQFREFDEQGIAFVPLLARPLFVYQLRNKYLQVGRSDHRQMHHRMLKSLEETFQRAGDTTTKFYISFLDDEPRPDAAVIQALNDGASHIIVSEVFLTVSNHTAEGESLIKEVDVEAYGATLAFTGPLWDSATLKSMFTKRAAAHIGDTAPSKIGVLLVGHGQPDEWDVEWPTETEHETLFRQSVLKQFEAAGYRPENLSLAWMEFKDPKPARKVEEFLNNGVQKILFYSAAISADSIHSMYDVPELVSKAKVPDGFPILNLGAWNDDPIVIQAIREKIVPFLPKTP